MARYLDFVASTHGDWSCYADGEVLDEERHRCELRVGAHWLVVTAHADPDGSIGSVLISLTPMTDSTRALATAWLGGLGAPLVPDADRTGLGMLVASNLDSSAVAAGEAAAYEVEVNGGDADHAAYGLNLFRLEVLGATGFDPEPRPTTAAPTPSATPVSRSTPAPPPSDASLVGTWGCHVVQPGVGYASASTGGLRSVSGRLGSFEILDGSSYAGLNGSGTGGSFEYDAASRQFTFVDGGLYGLVGEFGVGPSGDWLGLEGVGNGWDDPHSVNLVCVTE